MTGNEKTEELSELRKQELLSQMRRPGLWRKPPKKPISRYAAGIPYRNAGSKESGPQVKVEVIPWLGAPSASDIGEMIDALPRASSKAISRVMSKYDHDSLYSLAMGLPSRVRSFVKRVWKREDKFGERWDEIAYGAAEAASKILEQRLDLVLLFGLIVDQHGMPSDERLFKMTRARSECDALLTLYCHYFIVGTSAKIASICLDLKSPNSDQILGGLIDVIDFGRNEPVRRKRRLEAAVEAINKNGWKLPTREHLK